MYHTLKRLFTSILYFITRVRSAGKRWHLKHRLPILRAFRRTTCSLAHRCARLIQLATSEHQSDPAAHWPDQQPRQQIPMGESFAPVRNRRADTHRLTDDEEPKHVAASPSWRKPCAQPGA